MLPAVGGGGGGTGQFIDKPTYIMADIGRQSLAWDAGQLNNIIITRNPTTTANQ